MASSHQPSFDWPLSPPCATKEVMDAPFMRAAIALSRRALGTTWPNPAVGCVIVQEGAIIAQGVTAPGGRPHAETQTLAMAGEGARGATAYVTLEPCSHHGQTPPCAQALIDAGVARVVIGARDPDPRVDGAGAALLREAGIEVTEGVLTDEATLPLQGFLLRVTANRPYITLKLATTLDGRIATASGDSQWITGTPARKSSHGLRGRHDATMVGVGTVLADDPDLTCRIPGYAPRPAPRIVADSHLRTPLTARIVATAHETPTWILHRDGADASRVEALTEAGVTCLETAGDEVGVDPHAAMAVLAQAGLTSILLEGGARLAAAMLRAGLVDRLALYQAPSVIGGDGIPAVQAMGVALLDQMPRFRRVALTGVGDDLLTEFTRIS
jgi:diaminohydroxyphosphoribosylaminopyrimidine deaminase/5-amino-6-(5-phosphoribosylamino)uracil reductase